VDRLNLYGEVGDQGEREEYGGAEPEVVGRGRKNGHEGEGEGEKGKIGSTGGNRVRRGGGGGRGLGG